MYDENEIFSATRIEYLSNLVTKEKIMNWKNTTYEILYFCLKRKLIRYFSCIRDGKPQNHFTFVHRLAYSLQIGLIRNRFSL